MSLLLGVLLMLGLVAVSGVGALRLRLPLPLLQIALGCVAAWPAFGLHLPMASDVFMLLFLPPLLFSGGWQMPKRELRAYRGAIFLLSTALLLASVLLVGWFAHWLIPSLPLAMCFVLAAVLSPTDAVALAAMPGAARLPARLRHTLEGESLANDATGLVAVKFALMAAASTQFSVIEASVDYLLIAGGGLAIGALFSLSLSLLYFRWLRGERTRSDIPTVLLILVLPYAPYLLAEHCGCSGILAAVAAGVVASMVDVRFRGVDATRMHAKATWDVLNFSFDGLVFVLLGAQLPALLRHLPGPHGAPSSPDLPQVLVLYGSTAALALAMYAVRFAWLALPDWYAARALDRRLRRCHRWSPRLAALGTLAGVRGAISLAAALSLPLAFADGRAVPGRDLIVFVSACVIIGSLLLANLLLPLLMHGMPGEHSAAKEQQEQRWARRRALNAALRRLEQHRDTGPGPLEPSSQLPELSERLCAEYRERLALATQPAGLDEPWSAPPPERSLRLVAMEAARAELQRLRLSHRINDLTLQALCAEIDLEELSQRLGESR